MAESKKELKNLLMSVKEEIEKAGLKLNVKKTKIMASGLITSQQIEEEKVQVMTDFFFLGSKSLWMMTAAMKLRRRLLLGRKAMANLDSVLKSRDVTLPTEVSIVKAMVFPVVTYICESWTIRRQSTKELMPSNCGAGEDS